jgi:hypothetical protein
MDGSAWSWLHFQAGVPAFASDVWRVPEASGKGEEKTTDAEARIAHGDAVGRGFVAWHRFDHPELGAVEVGGFVHARDFELAPDGDARAALFAAHHRFFVEQAGHGPDVRIRSLTAEALGRGAHRIEAVVVNDGDWPSQVPTADRTRRFSSPRLKLVLQGGATLVGGGDPLVTTQDLEALGGKHELSWIVTGPKGARVRLELTCDPVGTDRREVQL